MMDTVVEHLLPVMVQMHSSVCVSVCVCVGVCVCVCVSTETWLKAAFRRPILQRESLFSVSSSFL